MNTFRKSGTVAKTLPQVWIFQPWAWCVLTRLCNVWALSWSARVHGFSSQHSLLTAERIEEGHVYSYLNVFLVPHPYVQILDSLRQPSYPNEINLVSAPAFRCICTCIISAALLGFFGSRVPCPVSCFVRWANATCTLCLLWLCSPTSAAAV